MGFKRFLGRAGKFAGKAALQRAGLIGQGSHPKLTPEIEKQLTDIVRDGMLAALLQYDVVTKEDAQGE